MAPLLEINPETGQLLDYWEFSGRLEKIREKYSNQNIDIHIIGFAKLLGDLINGIGAVALFFAGAFIITAVLLYIYCRCLQKTIAPLLCSLVAVVWQLGILKLLGFGLDPYSVLVPFLVFAIGVSHGVQMMNAVALEAGTGLSVDSATKAAFRDLFAPGISALLSDAVGFLTLVFIEIKVIQELGIAASIGVAAIILTNLVLLPLIVPYIGISESGIKHAQAKKYKAGLLTGAFVHFTKAKPARIMLFCCLALAAFGLYLSQDLKIGDLDKGAPELRPDSRYNQDIGFVTENYSTSSDVLIVMTETGKDECVSYKTMDAMDRLQWELAHVKGVQATNSAVNFSKFMGAMLSEGNMKWYALSRNQKITFNTVYDIPPGFISGDCNLSNMFVFLDDHKAETLTQVTETIERFGRENNIEGVKFLLAAGSAGIEAATNQTIKRSQMFMLIFVYFVVTCMVFLTFRSWRAVVCIIVPLALTSILCQALMAVLGIGVKVATLPVIALGVGIGVDYGIYIYSKMREFLREGLDLQTAYGSAMKTTGRAVTFTGLTLAASVFTWFFAPIKFQADMGVLLTFMFLWNMLGVMTLLPALAHFLIKDKKDPVTAKASTSK